MQPEDFRNYYREYSSVAKYRRNERGTVALSVVTIIGVALFVLRFWPLLLGKDCSWTLFNRLFIPPIQYFVYCVMIYETPEKNTDTLCLFGQILVNGVAFSYYLLMSAMSYLNNSIIELVIYILLILVHTTVMLPVGVDFFKPFLRRPESEIENEKFEIVKKYEFKGGHDSEVVTAETSNEGIN